MRLDVREQTIRAAAAELRENDCYIVLVSAVIVDELRESWSPLVQVMMERSGHAGIAEMTVREVQAAEQARTEDAS